ncbi:MAG: hypothetical protein AAGC71_07515 [Pseudomonadota bacterium]
MSVDALRAAFDSLSRHRLPSAEPVADSGWLRSPDARQRLRLLAFPGAEAGYTDVYFRAFGEPALLVLADRLCLALSESLQPWPRMAELALPIDVRKDQVGLLLVLDDAVAALVRSVPGR